MAEIEKDLIILPKNILINIYSNNTLALNGQYGIVKKSFLDLIYFIILIFNNKIYAKGLYILVISDKNEIKGYFGLSKILIANMIQGVTQTFYKTLITEGIGYKFRIEKDNLILNIGLSHLVKLNIPTNLTAKVESPTKLTIMGNDKEIVTFFAAKIRDMKKPEPYKGKGILYDGEKILRKAGKTGR